MSIYLTFRLPPIKRTDEALEDVQSSPDAPYWLDSPSWQSWQDWKYSELRRQCKLMRDGVTGLAEAVAAGKARFFACIEESAYTGNVWKRLKAFATMRDGIKVLEDLLCNPIKGLLPGGVIPTASVQLRYGMDIAVLYEWKSMLWTWQSAYGTYDAEFDSEAWMTSEGPQTWADACDEYDCGALFVDLPPHATWDMVAATFPVPRELDAMVQYVPQFGTAIHEPPMALDFSTHLAVHFAGSTDCKDDQGLLLDMLTDPLGTLHNIKPFRRRVDIPSVLDVRNLERAILQRCYDLRRSALVLDLFHHKDTFDNELALWLRKAVKRVTGKACCQVDVATIPKAAGTANLIVHEDYEHNGMFELCALDIVLMMRGQYATQLRIAEELLAQGADPFHTPPPKTTRCAFTPIFTACLAKQFHLVEAYLDHSGKTHRDITDPCGRDLAQVSCVPGYEDLAMWLKRQQDRPRRRHGTKKQQLQLQPSQPVGQTMSSPAGAGEMKEDA